jgi:hypothetical protein
MGNNREEDVLPEPEPDIFMDYVLRHSQVVRANLPEVSRVYVRTTDDTIQMFDNVVDAEYGGGVLRIDQGWVGGTTTSTCIPMASVMRWIGLVKK